MSCPKSPATATTNGRPGTAEHLADIVDRFNSPDAEAQAFSLRLVTVDSPDWRVRVQRLLNPVAVQTPGVQAWLLEKEAAAVLLSDLRRRSDYREHSSPYLLVNNGQSAAVSATRGRNYIRNIRLRPEVEGGSLMDVGCYCVSGSRLLAGDPEQVYGQQFVGPSGTDWVFTGTMRFPGDVFAQFDCGTALPERDELEAIGSDGSVES